MTILVVRHGVAEARKGWRHADLHRPLTDRGRAQAKGLVELLGDHGITRVLSSPSVRCVDTVRPLAAALGLAVEEVPQLAEGKGAAAAVLVDLSAGETVVLCSHGDVIPLLVAALGGADAMETAAAKGSTWVIDDDGAGGRPRYLPPPA